MAEKPGSGHDPDNEPTLETNAPTAPPEAPSAAEPDSAGGIDADAQAPADVPGALTAPEGAGGGLSETSDTPAPAPDAIPDPDAVDEIKKSVFNKVLGVLYSPWGPVNITIKRMIAVLGPVGALVIGVAGNAIWSMMDKPEPPALHSVEVIKKVIDQGDGSREESTKVEFSPGHKDLAREVLELEHESDKKRNGIVELARERQAQVDELLERLEIIDMPDGEKSSLRSDLLKRKKYYEDIQKISTEPAVEIPEDVNLNGVDEVKAYETADELRQHMEIMDQSGVPIWSSRHLVKPGTEELERYPLPVHLERPDSVAEFMESRALLVGEYDIEEYEPRPREPVALAVVLDTDSEMIAQEKIEYAREAMKRLINDLDNGFNPEESISITFYPKEPETPEQELRKDITALNLSAVVDQALYKAFTDALRTEAYARVAALEAEALGEL